jgi:hypothetical protein
MQWIAPLGNRSAAIPGIDIVGLSQRSVACDGKPAVAAVIFRSRHRGHGVQTRGKRRINADRAAGPLGSLSCVD